jgi:DNA-binding NtrC family response regulator/PAS domain-containing protein
MNDLGDDMEKPKDFKEPAQNQLADFKGDAKMLLHFWTRLAGIERNRYEVFTTLLYSEADLGFTDLESLGLPSEWLKAWRGTSAHDKLIHALCDWPKGLSDLAAPRLEDAIFRILQSDQSPVGFFIKDLSNKYVYVNLSMATFLGKTASAMVGLTDAQLYPDEDETVSTRNLEQVIGGKMVHLQRRRTVKGVPTILQEILVAKRGNRYDPVGVYGICWEVHESGDAMDLSVIDDTEYPSQIMGLALRECLRLAQTDTHVLLTGEKGSGKDHLAREIHEHSKRSGKELVPINCSEFTTELMSSELFGHVKGAFTGATQDNPGLAAQANGSTLFLNEIGEMPLHLQPKLLTFVENGIYRRVGSNKTEKADVRIIAATNKDLEEEVAAGRFRSDLYDRLNVFHVLVPPLRRRLEDIPVLVKQLLTDLCGKELPAVEDQVLEMFSLYNWPGNVRELKNVLERALVLSRRGIITRAHIKLDAKSAAGADVSDGFQEREELKEISSRRKEEFDAAKKKFRQLDREDQVRHIAAMFKDICGRESGAITYIAELLGISQGTVRQALKAAYPGQSRTWESLKKSRPRKGAREELIPRMKKYFLEKI